MGTVRKRIASLALVAGLFGSLAAVAPSRAAYIVTFSEVGPDVVASGTGSINLAGLIRSGGSTGPAFIVPDFAVERTGPTTTVPADVYFGVSGPSSFGVGSLRVANSGSGDFVGVNGRGRFIYVPSGYLSGAPLSDMSTYLGQSFSTLGVVPGTYTYTWASDSFTVQITPPPSVPEPASMALLGVGLTCLALARRRSVS